MHIPATPPPTDDLSLRERKKQQTRTALHESARALVLARGAAVTVDEICRDAGVSPRTFFNYYPSKAAAALALPDLRIGEAQVDAFLAEQSGPIVPGLCRLVAQVFDTGGKPDKAAVRDLLTRWPELRPEVLHWMAEVRRGFLDIAERRVSALRARAAVTLVFAALMEAMEHGTARGDLEARLTASVAEMVAAATEPAQSAIDAVPIA